MSYSTDREAFEALLAASSTPLNPMGGDGVDRCRLCYELLPGHAAHCLLPAFQEREGKLTIHEGDFDDLRRVVVSLPGDPDGPMAICPAESGEDQSYVAMRLPTGLSKPVWVLFWAAIGSLCWAAFCVGAWVGSWLT